MNSNGNEWRKVGKRKRRQNYTEPTVYPTHHYWNGFWGSGKKKWFIELSDGSVLNYFNEDYTIQVSRFYDRRKRGGK